MITDDLLEEYEKLDSLAREVLLLSRNTLLVNLRFLDMSLSRFEYVNLGAGLATDSNYLFYNPAYVLKEYISEKEESIRGYLHMVLHCVFRHMYVSPKINHDIWNLSCDIAVENIINGLNISSLKTKRSSLQETYIKDLKAKSRYMTAEKLYDYLSDYPYDEKTMTKLNELFNHDSHEIWYIPAEISLSVSKDVSSDDASGGNNGEDGNEEGDSGTSLETEGLKSSASKASEQFWENVSRRMEEDLENFSKNRGDEAGNLIQNLKEVNRERYDYTSFLKKFAVMGETMKINDDEFDYIFYTYGLNRYGNMPLIEPLEYKEVKRIKEFVIAIDTSGSVQGEEVQSFLNKTYNILMSEESFFTKINLHLIQCDTLIQEDIKITSRREFEEYLKTMELKGFGGTDFRPVFEYVKQLKDRHEFANLKGLIYFTDGYGLFPEQMPDYKTAFVFVRDDYEIPEVPSWAIKLVLEKEDI